MQVCLSFSINTQAFNLCCFLSGILNVLATNPLWVVNSRLKMSGVNKDGSQYRGLVDGLIKIALQVSMIAGSQK